jgi:hypothetical protein
MGIGPFQQIFGAAKWDLKKHGYQNVPCEEFNSWKKFPWNSTNFLIVDVFVVREVVPYLGHLLAVVIPDNNERP